MANAKKILVQMMVEECGIEKGDKWDDDPVVKYVVYPNSHFAAEGEVYFSCRRKSLESHLKMIFKVEDPFMEKTAGLIPNMHTSLARMGVGNGYGQVGSSTYKPVEGKSGYVPFLTRDPIYKEPEGSTKDLITEIGTVVLGREPGAVTDLLGDLIEDLMSPKKRKL